MEGVAAIDTERAREREIDREITRYPGRELMDSGDRSGETKRLVGERTRGTERKKKKKR